MTKYFWPITGIVVVLLCSITTIRTSDGVVYRIWDWAEANNHQNELNYQYQLFGNCPSRVIVGDGEGNYKCLSGTEGTLFRQVWFGPDHEYADALEATIYLREEYEDWPVTVICDNNHWQSTLDSFYEDMTDGVGLTLGVPEEIFCSNGGAIQVTQP